MVAHVVAVFDTEEPKTPPPTPAEPAEAPAAAEVPVIPTSMVAHVVEVAPAPEAPAEAAPIPTSMVAHVVEEVVAAPEAPAAAPAPVELESWKKDAFEAVNKNSSVHDVVPVTALAAPVAPVAPASPAAPAEKKTYKIVMIRHGESEWNNENRFCGWFDAGLSTKGTFAKQTLTDIVIKELCDQKKIAKCL